MTVISSALIVGGLGLVGSVIGSRNSNNTARQVSQDATQTASNNNAQLLDIYNRNSATLRPDIDRGARAGAAMDSLLGLSGDPRAYDQAFQQYRDSTGYQFQLDEGNRAVQNSAASRGGLLSGSAIKAGQRYGQGVASSAFQQFLDRLYGQQGIGLTAGSAQAGVGTNFGQQTGANNNAALDARSNASLSSAGNTNQLIASLAGTAGNVLGQQSFGSTYGSSPTAFNGGSLTGWADGLRTNSTRIPLYG